MGTDDIQEQVLHLRDTEGLSWVKVGEKLGFGPNKARKVYKEAGGGSTAALPPAVERVGAPNPTRASRKSTKSSGSGSRGASSKHGRKTSKKYKKQAKLKEPDNHNFIFEDEEQFSEEAIIKLFQNATQVEWVYPLGNVEEAYIISFEWHYHDKKDGRLIFVIHNEHGHMKYVGARRIIFLQ